VIRIKFKVFLFILLLIRMASGTAQTPDNIIFKGKVHDLLCAPLESLNEDSSGIVLPRFGLNIAGSDTDIVINTSNWRGYVATWKITNDTLYLIDINDGKYDLAKIFGNLYIDGKVLAFWYSGDLIIGDGELLSYIHMGFMSKHEKETVIEINRGIVISVQEYENEERDPPRGYARMMTLNLIADIPKSLHHCYNPISDTLCLTDKKGNINIYGFTIKDPINRFDKSIQKLFVAQHLDSCAQSYGANFIFGEPTFENQRYGYIGWINGVASDNSGMMRILVMSNFHSRLFVFILYKGNDLEYYNKMTDIFCHSLVFVEFGD
jgi:hypothetical protein